MIKIGNRVQETTSTTGDGDITLDGPVSSEFQAFSDFMDDGDWTYYCIFGNGQWEVGYGQYDAGTNSLSRIAVDGTSDTFEITLLGGENVICQMPAEFFLRFGLPTLGVWEHTGIPAGSRVVVWGNNIEFTGSGDVNAVVIGQNITYHNNSYFVGENITGLNGSDKSGAVAYLATLSALGGFCTGIRSNSYIASMRAHSSGRFAANGDAQFSDVHLMEETTDATQTALTAANEFVPFSRDNMEMPDNTTWLVRVRVVARQVGGTAGTVGNSAAYTWEGLCKHDTGTTITILGTPSVNVVHEDDANWDLSVAADGSNPYLNVLVTGAADQTIRWSARIELEEVAG